MRLIIHRVMSRLMVIVRLFSVLGIGLLSVNSSGLLARAATPASSDPPCDGWTLHTRTLASICPEVVIDSLSGQGVAAIGALAFDSRGALYVSRPATGTVLRLLPDPHQAGKFLPPETVAIGLSFPNGVACAEATCFVTTGTQIIRLMDKTVLASDLTPYEVHPLHVDHGNRLWTSSGHSMISMNLDGSDKHISTAWSSRTADFTWTPSGILWASDGDSRIQSDATNSTAQRIDFSPSSGPTGLTFYSNRAGTAFPQFANGLLVVTSGSWNTIIIEGYELWFIPFSADQAGSPQPLIPADTVRTNSDAALYLLTFFPDHPVAVAVSPEGWIYVAVREGRVIRLRPRIN